jgi:uncharacterized damage-inducible protein DinB
MNDLAQVWHFTRVRLAQAIEGLNDAQVQWRPYEGGHNIGELLYHIAGVEWYWAWRMAGFQPEPDSWEARLDNAARDGFLNDLLCPFQGNDLTAAKTRYALQFAFEHLQPVLENPSPEQLAMQAVSPIGDPVTAHDGLVRVVQHAGYHTGQIWMIRMDPRFPKG